MIPTRFAKLGKKQGYEMVIQLHENDLDGQFLFGQDSRIILTKKLADRSGLAGQRLRRTSSGHRRQTSSSRENQNRRIEHLFSNLNISNHQNRNKTSLRATSSASSVPSSRSSNQRSEQSANQQPLHLARDTRSESSMFKRQAN